MPDPGEPFPFRCRNAGRDDVDHVIVRRLDPARVRFPPVPPRPPADPFVAYRGLLHAYHRAVAGGLGDAGYTDLVGRLEERVAAVDGRPFAATPLRRDPLASDRLGFREPGGVWVKDETGNVAGSHKGRHLMGLLVYLEVVERLGLADPAHRRPLAIASCGNAALAAAVVARAGDRRLRVFVPVDADAAVVVRLRSLGADVVVCPREPDRPGDPTYHRLRAELAAGALPFTCQGSENGLAVEGGQTLGYELVSALGTGGGLDHLVVQVGGGALASACVHALDEAVELGVLARLPRLHTVQTRSAHPLERAYHRLRARLGPEPGEAEVAAAVADAAAHRSAFMWPWESEPKSIAGGILDDETYDWLAVVDGMLRTGGGPVVCAEDALAGANRLGTAAGYRVDPTGTAGLAGLVELRAAGVVSPTDRAAVLFTGVRRDPPPVDRQRRGAPLR